MAKTRSMTRNQSYEASSRKRMKTCEKGVVVPWSDLNHDVLFLVMMQLGVVDFLAFSGVCKSWRSIALSNRNSFMASRPPMRMLVSITNEKDDYCYLQDFEGRRFKTILPHFAGRTYYGITCGHLILFGRETNDFLLVNPITRHELHFTDIPFHVSDVPIMLRAILVFSPSISGWVFVLLNVKEDKIWLCTAGTGAWNHVSSTFPLVDLHAFKGKIYTLNSHDLLCEIKLNPQPRLTLLETKNLLKTTRWSFFVSSEENLYLMEYITEDCYKVHEINFSEMKWMLHKSTPDEYIFYISTWKRNAAVKPKSWADSQSQYEKYADTNKTGRGRLFIAIMWYFPHDCLNVDLIHE